MWSFFGVLVGNLIGVLPGMGALSAISMLLPLTYTMHPVPAILMLAGIFYGSHVRRCDRRDPAQPAVASAARGDLPRRLSDDRAGQGWHGAGHHHDRVVLRGVVRHHGDDLRLAAAGEVALKFGPTEIFSIMLLGLLAGGTMSRGSPLKGVAMTVIGLLIGIVGHRRQQRRHALHVRLSRA